MADIKLGNKHECGVCGTKFYDFGKSKAICPKCGTDQKKIASQSKPGAAPRRRRPIPVAEEDTAGGVFGDSRGDLDTADLDSLDEEEDDNGEDV